MDASLITFSPLQKTDLVALYTWLNQDYVKKWWGNEGDSLEKVTEKYTPYIDGKEPSLGFIIRYDDKPIGFIQTYKISDYPDYVKQLAIEGNAAGVDLLIGEKEYIGKGLGPLAIKKFVEEEVFKKYDVDFCTSDPAVENIASVKAFQKAGFDYMKDSFDPETGEKEVLLRYDRK